MTGLIRYAGLAVAILALGAAGPAWAQENLEAGKTAAELYTSNCAICHKSPHGLSEKVGIFGLDSFLREHYTSSHASAAAITAYLQAIDRESAPVKERTKRAGKAGYRNEHKAKLEAAPTKPSESKSSDTKSSDTKSSEKKSGAGKPAAGGHEQAKAAGTKASETKPKTETKKKPAATKTEAAKTNSDKPAKDDKPQKSD
jgi:hypothetical protein